MHLSGDKVQEVMLATTAGKVVMILDSGCRRSVAGRKWHHKMQEECRKIFSEEQIFYWKIFLNENNSEEQFSNICISFFKDK